jgi:hypothetical protein
MAAIQIAKPSKTLRDKVHAYLKARPEGATDEEISIDLDLQSDTARPRRRELQIAGLVMDSGYTRKTTNNREAVVWKIINPNLDPHRDPEQGRLLP